MSQRPTRREDFQVAIVCSYPFECDAVALHFDEFWGEGRDSFGRSVGDFNTYTTGRIGRYDVVLALRPNVDKIPMADAVAGMRLSYSALRLVILTGICDGMPFTGQAELLLGDVIISNAFVRCDDIGVKYENNQSQSLVYMSSNDVNIRSFFASLHAEHGLYLLQQRTAYFLRQPQKTTSRQTRYNYPGAAEDKLFESTYRHIHRNSVTCMCKMKDAACGEVFRTSCDDLGCDEEYLVARARLTDQNMQTDRQMPALHIGKVASVDVMLKKGEDRDVIAKKEGVIAFDDSWAWGWKDTPVILVKGISSYADGHKNNKWQNYASATAASAIKAILERYPQTGGDPGQHIEEPPRGHFLVPTKRNPNFIGRETILSKLLAKISPDLTKDGYYKAAITGHKGVGKTQIALEAVYRLHDKYTDYPIFWVSAKDPETFENCYYQIGKRIKIKEIDNEEADIKQLVKTTLSEESSGSWLLVIDDPDALMLSRLSNYLPFSQNGLILFIVQGTGEAERLDIPKQNIFPIEGLDIGEALSLAQ
ncbi:nucleoside phosphorylase domain-containing protein [Trichoderma sp. SZMC 28013]